VRVVTIVVGYCRVSTEQQATEGVSLEAQRERIASWCAHHAYSFDPAAVFEDRGISGKRIDNRPELRKALDLVCREKGVLVVYSLSRLARSTKDAIAIAERLDKAGADLVSLSEDINTTTASGKMIFRLLAVLAEFERDLVAERTRNALARKRTKGERLGQVPYGVRLDADGCTLTPDTAEAEAVAFARARRADGWSLRRIARALDGQLPPKNGGPRWSPSTVHRLTKGTALAPPEETAAVA